MAIGTSALTVKVLNISTRAKPEDIIIFFSYCGTIDDIRMEKDGDQAQLALITFKQNYAYQTALLLNGAILMDRQVCILPLKYSVDLQPESSKYSKLDKDQNDARAEELDKKKINSANEKSSSAYHAVEQAAGQLGSTILSSTCFSKSALWLSDILNKASKTAADLGNYKYRNTNSRKRK